MIEKGSHDPNRFSTQTLRPAWIIRTICQMLLGAGLAVTLILKVYMLVLTDHQCVADATSLGNAIRCANPLEIMSYTLALAAGFELAFLLFDDSDDRAVRPLVFGLSATILFVLSDLGADTANWQVALTLMVTTIALFGGLLLRQFFAGKISVNSDPEEKP